jgi:hypothetical protein
MYDLAKTIQQDRRRHACAHRMVSEQSRSHSVTVGRYRVTVHRRGRGVSLGS